MGAKEGSWNEWQAPVFYVEKKKRPEQPAKADDAEWYKMTDACKAEIAKNKKRIAEITKETKKREEGWEEFEKTKKDLLWKLKAAERDWESANSSVDSVRKDLQQVTSQTYKDQGTLKQLKRELETEGEELIDQKVKQMEFRMSTRTMTLQDEKKLVEKIQKMKKKKPEMAQKAHDSATLEQQITVNQESRAPLQNQIKEYREHCRELAAIKTERDNALWECKKKRKAQVGDIKALLQEKSDCQWHINDQQKKMRAADRAYNNADKKWNDWKWQCDELDRKEKEEEKRLEQEHWEQEKKKEELSKKAERPYFEEMILLEQTLDYLKDLIAEKPKAEEKAAENLELEGMTVINKKATTEGTFAFGGDARKKTAKPKRESKKKQDLKHGAGTIQLFAQLKMVEPRTLDDVPDRVGQVQEKLKYYQAKMKRWEDSKANLEAEVAAFEKKVKESQEKQTAIRDAALAAARAEREEKRKKEAAAEEAKEAKEGKEKKEEVKEEGKKA